MRTLFIDPGTKRLGWAEFAEGDRTVRLCRSGVVIAARKDPWKKRMDFMVREVVKRLQMKQTKEKMRIAVYEVTIEMPQQFQSARGQAALNSGAVMKLIATVFSLRQALLERGYGVRLVNVSKWKGQVKKKVTAKRVQRWWGKELTADEELKGGDELDACGIGDWWYRRGSGKKWEIVK